VKLRIDIEKKQGDFSLKVKTELSGERVGIFGASGSGKSTLIHLISGLTKPDNGRIELDGDCLFDSIKGIDLSPEKRRIAIVFQQATLFPHLSVKSNLLYGYKRCKPSERRISLEAVMKALNLEHLIERGVNKLSGGEKQRVALGRAVLANPRLLVMDEPLSALDDSLRYQIIPYLRSVSEEFGIPCLFISHSLTEMRLMTEQVMVIKQGRLDQITTPNKLARANMALSPHGYLNLLRLSNPSVREGLHHYPWGDQELIISDGRKDGASLFELSSRDIILFKNHPEAISARNLLECNVMELFDADGRKGVVLESDGKTLVAEIVRAAAEELGINPGTTVFAAIKASAFRKLG